MNFTPQQQFQRLKSWQHVFTTGQTPVWLLLGHHPVFFQALDDVAGGIARHDLRLGSLAAAQIRPEPERRKR